MTVQTVTGPVEAHELGRTLMHEHVVLRTPGVEENYPGAFPRAEVVAVCVDKLARLKQAGIDTVVDHTPFDLGRDVQLLAEVSQASGMQIVACTGIWVDVPRYFSLRSSDHIAELFVRDLEGGVAGTGIRAGIIKCAVDVAGLTPPVERVLRAAARAALATGVPISTHTWVEGRTGEVQQRVFAEEGVDLSRVLIGHSGDSDDLGYLHALLAQGSYLGMDRFGTGDERLSDERRVGVVAELCAAGHADRLFLSHDANCWSDKNTEEQRRRERPDWHYHHVLDAIVPLLLSEGVSREQIDTMLVSNPAAFFGRA